MELVSGMKDIMVFIEAVKQGNTISVMVLCPLKAVLGKIYLLLEEIERSEKERQDHGGTGEEPA